MGWSGVVRGGVGWRGPGRGGVGWVGGEEGEGEEREGREERAGTCEPIEFGIEFSNCPVFQRDKCFRSLVSLIFSFALEKVKRTKRKKRKENKENMKKEFGISFMQFVGFLHNFEISHAIATFAAAIKRSFPLECWCLPLEL